ncbi:MAG: hypothetical protein IMZ50_06635, partial [Candidatus Atribacteria bacterium]|nr:hypothetical protein [Candidatus Atribacteria bacterium]
MTALMTYKEAMDVEPVQQSVPMLLSHAEALEAEPARPTTGILTYAQAMEAGPPNPVAPTVPQAPPAAPQAVQPTAPAQAAPAAVPAVRPGAQVDAVSGAQPAEPTPAPGWPTWVNDEPGFERVTPARIEATTQKETPDSSAEWFLSMSIAELERKARIKRDLAQVAMPGGGTLAKVNLTGVREGVAQQETVNALQKLYNDPLDRHITGMMLQQLKASGHALTTDQFVAMLPVLQKSRETIRKTLTESEMKELAARKEAALSKPLLTKLRDAVVLAGLNIPSTLERFASTANVPMVNYGPAYNAEKIDAIIAQHPERQPAQLESFKELMSNPSEVAAQVIGVLPYIVGSVAAGALGTVAAGPGGGAAAMFGFTGAMEGQMWYQQAIADGASKEEAEQGRVVVGAINGMIEVAQVGRIVSLARGGKAIVVKRATQSALRKLAGKTMSSEVVHQTVRNALEEALQNAVQEYGAKVAYGKDIQPGFLGRELQNAVVGALAYGGPAMVAGVGGAGVRALGKPTAPLPGPEMPVGQVIGPRGGEAGAVVGPTAVEQRTVVPRQAGAEVGKVTSPLAPVSEFDRLYAEPATPNVAGATPNVAPPAAAPAQEAVAPQAQPEPAKPAAPVAEAADRGVQEALSQEGVKPVPEGYNKETGVGRMAVTKVNGETRFAVTVQDPETRRSVLVGNDLNADDSFALYQKLKYGEPAPSNTPSRPPSQADVPIAAPTDYSTMPRPALVAEARKRGLPPTGTVKALRERLAEANQPKGEPEASYVPRTPEPYTPPKTGEPVVTGTTPLLSARPELDLSQLPGATITDQRVEGHIDSGGPWGQHSPPYLIGNLALSKQPTHAQQEYLRSQGWQSEWRGDGTKWFSKSYEAPDSRSWRPESPSAPAAETGKGEGKQTWEMTKTEFAADNVRYFTEVLGPDTMRETRQANVNWEKNAGQVHQAQVEAAVKRGDSVSQEVLADYASEPWAKAALAKMGGEAKPAPAETAEGKPPVEVPPTLAEKAKVARTEFNDALDKLGDMFGTGETSGMARIFDPALIKQMVVTIGKMVKAGGYTLAEALEVARARLAAKIGPDKARQVMAEVEKAQKAEEAPPEAATPEGKRLYGIKNAVVDAERASAGLPPATHGEQRAHQTAVAEAERTFKDDPRAAGNLVSELLGRPRPLTDTEGALLLLDTVRLENEITGQRAKQDAALKAGDEVAARDFEIRATRAVQDLDALQNAVTVAGTKNAQALAFRRAMMAEDYSLVHMRRAM